MTVLTVTMPQVATIVIIMTKTQINAATIMTLPIKTVVLAMEV